MQNLIKDVLCSERTLIQAEKILKNGDVRIETSKSLIEGYVQTERSNHFCTISYDGSYTCPCEGTLIWHRDRICTHVCALLYKIENVFGSEFVIDLVKRIIRRNVMSKKIEVDVDVIPSSLSALNDLFNGYPVESLFAVYGPHEGGKTILSIQADFDIFKYYLEENKEYVSGLHIDLEGSLARHALPDWIKRLNVKYKLDVKLIWIKTHLEKDGSLLQLICRTNLDDIKEEKKEKTEEIIKKNEEEKIQERPKKKKIFKIKKKVDSKDDSDIDFGELKKGNYIFVIDMRSIAKVMTFHGRPIVIKISEHNKMDVLPQQKGYQFHIWDTQIGRFLSKYNIKYICYDSITQSLRSEFIGGRQNFPARADAINAWMNQIVKLAEEYTLVVVCINHETHDPANQWARAGFVGGESLAYFYKYVLYIDPYKSGKYAHLRKLWMERHPSKAPWKERRVAKLTNEGFIDIEIVDQKIIDKIEEEEKDKKEDTEIEEDEEN